MRKSRRKSKNRSWKIGFPRHFKDLLEKPPLIWIGIGWVWTFYSVLELLNFHPIEKTEMNTLQSLWHIWPLFLAGLTCMVIGYRRLPKKETRDLDRTTAWVWLAVILAAGAFLRLYQLGTPPGPFWDDWATILMWVHNVLDRNQFYWMFPSDGIEPFVPYVVTALQAIVPDEVKDIVMRRIAGCLVDLTAIWVLYLAGKELVSRRAGLAAAALGALGRPMIQLTLTGMRAYSLSLAVAFLALASLKLFRKPSLFHFILWSLALAFGVHTYSTFRVYMLILPFLLLPWVLKDPDRIKPLTWMAPLGAVFLLLGVYSGTFAATDPHFNPWADLWTGWTQRNWAIALIFITALAPSVLTAWVSFRRGLVSRLAGWSLSVGLSCLFILPMTLSREFNGRMGALSPFRNQDASRSILGFLTQQVWQTFRSLFYNCLDRNDLTIGTDPFYDLFSQGALLLALAFLIAKFDWKKAFLVILGGLGTLVYIISIDPSSTKLIASAPSWYLLAAWALDRLWAGLPPPPPKKKLWIGSILLTLLVTLYALWGGWIQHRKLFGIWAATPFADTQLALHVGLDEPRFRVYLAPSGWFFGYNAQFALEEGRRYYILKDTNVIPLRKGEKPQDIVIFVYGSNDPLIKTLHEQFPAAEWTKMFVFTHLPKDPNPELYMWRVQVKGDSVPFDPKFVLHREERTGSWLRRYYNSQFGWGLSGILKEERVPNYGDPVDSEYLNTKIFEEFAYAHLMQFLGEMRTDKSGDYEWSIRADGPVWVSIDGKLAFKSDSVTESSHFRFHIHLEPGVHQLEIRARFPYHYQIPEISWKEVGSQNGMDL